MDYGISLGISCFGKVHSRATLHLNCLNCLNSDLWHVLFSLINMTCWALSASQHCCFLAAILFCSTQLPVRTYGDVTSTSSCACWHHVRPMWRSVRQNGAVVWSVGYTVCHLEIMNHLLDFLAASGKETCNCSCLCVFKRVSGICFRFILKLLNKKMLWRHTFSSDCLIQCSTC